MGTLKFHQKGVYKTPSGHLRYSSPKEVRGKYVHRVVVDRLMEETSWYVKQLLPWPYEVHHMDYNKENNEPSNLLLLSESFHSALTADGCKGEDGKFGRKFNPKWKPAPPWVLFGDDSDVVPF